MNTAFPITIYHNPKCGTSRNTLGMIRAAGYEPTVVEYVQTGWNVAQLKELSKATGMTAHEMMRTKDALVQELGLMAEGIADEVIWEAMVVHPVLVNRPIVVTPKGTKLCRPSEVVFSLLERIPAAFVKEDGEVVKVG